MGCILFPQTLCRISGHSCNIYPVIILEEQLSCEINQCWFLLFQCQLKTSKLLQIQVSSDTFSPFVTAHHQSTIPPENELEVDLWCEALFPLVSTNIWQAWVCHKRPTFHHSSISELYCAEKATWNKWSRDVACWLLTVYGVHTCRPTLCSAGEI